MPISFELLKMACDAVKGGLAQNMPDSAVNQTQLRAGIKVEREHSARVPIQRDIAKDHLVEIPDYYTRLKAMENQAEAAGVKKGSLAFALGCDLAKEAKLKNLPPPLGKRPEPKPNQIQLEPKRVTQRPIQADLCQ